MRLRHASHSAFSLIELAIVLVILGLLVGGVLVGQSLIRASELRAANTEFTRYTTAMSAFRDKYMAIPGDMTNAASFWGAAAACPSVLATAAGGACNGDGNRLISPSSATSNEMYGFWEHLALAGLIEGSYSGSPNSATASATTSLGGLNVPSSKLNNGVWNIAGLNVADATSLTYFPASYSNALILGSGTSALAPTPLMKPEDAWNIDIKSDDGIPDQGAVVSLESEGSATAGIASTGCTNLAASATALAASTYRIDATSANCALIFKTGY